MHKRYHNPVKNLVESAALSCGMELPRRDLKYKIRDSSRLLPARAAVQADTRQLLLFWMKAFIV
jgi:hypothetical protein